MALSDANFSAIRRVLIASCIVAGLNQLSQNQASYFDETPKQPDRCGGEACIRDLRIPVWAVINYQRLGAADAEILQAYPSLRRSDLAAAYDYADAHADEIEAAIRRNEEEEEGIEE